MAAAMAVATTPLRAVIYCRVSSDPRQRWRSVREQEAECRTFAERMGWNVVQVFTDNDRSASRYAKLDRPEFARLKRFLSSGGCDVLLTWEGSRGQRDLAAYVELRNLSEAAGVLWSYDGDVFDMANARDRKRTAEDAIDAEYEVDRSRERIMRAMRANAAAGRPHGKRSYGYRRVYDPTTGDLLGQEPDPEQAPIVQEAARRYLAGESMYAIERDFNARGIPGPTGKPWTQTTIRRVITSPTNAGMRKHKDTTIPATWEPIIDQNDYARILAKLDGRAIPQPRAGVRHLLSGIARCGATVCDDCGAKMPMEPGPCASCGSTKSGHVCDERVTVLTNRGKYVAYTARCFHVSRRKGWVDDHVNALVRARLQQPDWAPSFAVSDGDAAAALTELATLQSELDGFYEQAAMGKLSPTALAKVEAGYLPRIADAERRASVTDVPPVLLDLVQNPAIYDDLDVASKRTIVRALFDALWILPARRGAKSFDPSTVAYSWR